MKIITKSEEETFMLGKHLGKFLKKPFVVELNGDMAAGKTHLAKGICAFFGVGREFSSPTYAIINKYSCDIYHMDAYRIEDIEEIEYTGLYDIVDEGIVLIEWASLIKEAEFKRDLIINITKKDFDERVIEFYSKSDEGKFVLDKLEKEYGRR